MPRITDIFLVETEKQEAFAIQEKVPVNEIPAAIGKGFMWLEEHINNKGMVASDTPFLKLIVTAEDTAEITMGIPIHGTVDDWQEMGAYMIPGGKKIFCYWQGDNSEMSLLYDEMKSYANNIGYEVQEGFYEYYLNGPEYGMDKLLTKYVMLLK